MSKKIQLSENALKVAEARYFIDENEDWEGCAQRVSRCLSEVEKDRKIWEDKFYGIISSMDFLPAGRILRNSGRRKGSLLNCYHLPCLDSIEDIGQFIMDSLILWSEGGGIGVNMSSLRPRGDEILGKGGKSSGMVSFLISADQVSRTIESGGQRRAAGLCSLDINHPEIEDFIDAKVEHNKISHFNISVMINDRFLEAVEKNEDWELKFKQKVYKKVKARYLWDKIINNMILHAEPGLLNTTNLFKNNSWYFDPVTGVNPCGEAVLSPYSACDLGSLVLPNFITGSTNTNWQKLEKTIKIAVRLLDNVLDVNKYSIRKIDEKCHLSRRIGLGITGLADYLFMKQLRYGSKEALSEVEKLMKFIRDVSYEASVELAVEKGSFPMFEPVNYCKSSFIRKLPATLRLDIKEKGIRNVSLMSIAPGGTISLLPEVCSGIEPLIYKAYKRIDKVGERIYIHPVYKELLKNGNSIPEWYVDMSDLNPKDHFEIQALVQKYTDGACSKTLNMPKGTTPDQLSRLLLEYSHDLKGIAVFVDGSIEGQIYNNINEDEARKYLEDDNVSNSYTEDDIKCSVCERKDDGIYICENAIGMN